MKKTHGKYRMKGLSIFRALFYLPNLIACTSMAFLFKTQLDWRFGAISQILMAAGVSVTPDGKEALALCSRPTVQRRYKPQRWRTSGRSSQYVGKRVV